MKAQHIAEPETRVGNCCGCQQLALLFKIEDIFRYRCAGCYEKEVGRPHPLATALSAAMQVEISDPWIRG